MSIRPKLQTACSDLEKLIHAVETTALDENEITSKVQSILLNAPAICEDPVITNLFRELDFSLNHHGLNEISQKVHQLVVIKKEFDETILHFHKALKDFLDATESGIGAAAHELLYRLKNLSGWENDLETRYALLELKQILEGREKLLHLSESWGFFILGSYYAAEPFILQLLQKSPERFGLNEEQVQKTVDMSLKGDLEGIKLLLLNKENLEKSGISKSFLQSETVRIIRTMLDAGSEVLDVLIDCPKRIEFHRRIRIKDVKPLSKQEVDRFYPIFSRYEIPYIEQHAQELGLTEVETRWILSNVEIEGLPPDIAFLLEKRFLEKGNYEDDLYRMSVEMAKVHIEEYSHVKQPRSWTKLNKLAGECIRTGERFGNDENENTYIFTVNRTRNVFNGEQVLELAHIAQGPGVLQLACICEPELLTQDELFSFAKLLRTKGASSCEETHYLWGIGHIESQERRLELLKMGIAQDPERFVTMDCSIFFKTSQEEALVSEPALQLFSMLKKSLGKMWFYKNRSRQWSVN